MLQSPMISSPLKQTNEVDWVQPLKDYIRHSYGDDPERYAEECNTLNRLRQDMRGAGKDSAAGRDLLYRYYGQLELLDLRFPVDENHIKISFTWFDAFTHKPTSQYSLAYEKASIIFNISAVLSCHAANQNRFDDTGLKTAYHSFQASAGMFTYINENFLHAPSTDLSRDTVKTLISLTLAQGQEVFLEKQVADQKKVGLLAKLASQAAYLLSQATEGIQENVTKGIFDKSWLQVLQVKLNYMSSLAQYYQALADDDANSHGVAIARLQIAENEGKEAVRIANAIASSISSTSNLAPDTAQSLNELTKRHLANVQEKFASFNKDNDFIYHQSVPSEAALAVIPKLPAAKAIPVSELYQGQDIQRIIGPDIFQRIVPMAVTESASLYDEEKAKLVRAEAESVETANGEMAASLDYLKLPGSLDILKGGLDQETGVDEEFRSWCHELAGHEPFGRAFEQLQAEKSIITSILDGCTKQLDMEESVCEKMRSKYGGDWTQQPSSRLTNTLREDIKSHRRSMDEAARSDSDLFRTSKDNEADFDEMRSAGETDEADVLYQRAMVKAGAGRGKSSNGISSPQGTLLDEDYGEDSVSVADQIAQVEDILTKLNLIKKDRGQVLKDLKEKVHNDDISNVLILNKKSLSSQEQQLFRGELEKFRPHQNRILQTIHKQMSILKELTKTYGDLLQDKRVRSEQSKYESFTRAKTIVLTKYKRIFQNFDDLSNGLMRAQGFYTEMRDTVESLEKNVEAFVGNRRAEGAQLLGQIEKDKSNAAGGRADQERDRLQGLMERMSLGSGSSPAQQNKDPMSRPPTTRIPDTSPRRTSPPPSMISQYQQGYPHYSSPVNGSREAPPPLGSRESYSSPTAPPPLNGEIHHPHHQQQQQYPPQIDPYNPMTYPYQPHPSQQQHQPPPQHMPPPHQSHYYPPQPHHPVPQQQQQQQYPPNMHHPGTAPPPQSYLPQGYVPPPPPPGPPPSNSQGNLGIVPQGSYPSGPGGYAQPPPPSRNGRRESSNTQQQHHHQSSGQNSNDPWAGLGAWK